jgi:IS5 family transposase
MEEQLNYNLMFLCFSHLSMENPIPDHSTISRWRSRLSKNNIFDKLLAEINLQMDKHGIKVKEGVC